MKRDLHNVDFEHLIKTSADQYRMYPSEKVWKGINSNLRPRSRWYGLGFLLLLVSSGLSTLFVISSKKTNLMEMDQTATISHTTTENVNQVPFSNHNNTEKVIVTKPQRLASVIPFSTIVPVKSYSDIAFVNPLTESFITEPTEIVSETINSKPNYLTQLTDQDEYFNGFSNSNNTPEITIKPTLKVSSKNDPLTIESVINSYKNVKSKNNVLFQAYFTPTISYRKLRDNKEFMSSGPISIPYGYAAYYNINQAVTHKPSMGLEIGIAAKYPISQGIRLKAGLQFNMTRYEIKAFNNPLEIATIALNNGYRLDSVNTFSSYRNFNGLNANWLKNFYFQVSLPVGAEVKLLGDDKIEFGISGTVQPTYVLGDRAYLISTDYKNYSEVPSLIRRWNVNTSLETYVAYSTGKLNWQVGPQVRYQMLSSFVNKYPVKENLFDFGFKVGIGLNK